MRPAGVNLTLMNGRGGPDVMLFSMSGRICNGALPRLDTSLGVAPGLKARPYLPNPSGPPVYSWNASQSATIFGLALRSSANTARSTAENARTVRSPSNVFSKPRKQRLHVSVRKNTLVRARKKYAKVTKQRRQRPKPARKLVPIRASAHQNLGAVEPTPGIRRCSDALKQSGGRIPRLGDFLRTAFQRRAHAPVSG